MAVRDAPLLVFIKEAHCFLDRLFIRLLTLLFLIMMLPLDASCQVNHSGTTFGASWTSITPAAIRIGSVTYAHDPVKLYELVRQAGVQKEAGIVYDALYFMCNKQPKNPVVLAAYCFAFDVAAGNYTFINRNLKERVFHQADQEHYQRMLNRAYQLDPHLWITYAVQGYEMASAANQIEKGMTLLRMAEKLAPGISIPHYLIGRVYTYGSPIRSYDKATEELQTATELKPRIAAAPLLLFDIHSMWAPDRDKAKQDKYLFLSSLPLGAQIETQIATRLARYP